MADSLVEAIEERRAQVEETRQELDQHLDALDEMLGHARRIEDALAAIGKVSDLPVTPHGTTPRKPAWQVEERRTRILQVLARSDGPVGGKRLREQVGSSRDEFRRDIQQLVNDGRVIRKGHTTATTYELPGQTTPETPTPPDTVDLDQRVLDFLDRQDQARSIAEIATNLTADVHLVRAEVNRHLAARKIVTRRDENGNSRFQTVGSLKKAERAERALDKEMAE